MLTPQEASSTATMLQGLLGVGVVVGTLVFLLGVCNANAWIVRLVESIRTGKPAATTEPPKTIATPAPSQATPPDHIMLVLAAAAAHILEEEIERVVILEVNAVSHWKLEGRLAIHRTRLTSKPVFLPAFPSGRNSK